MTDGERKTQINLAIAYVNEVENQLNKAYEVLHELNLTLQSLQEDKDD